MSTETEVPVNRTDAFDQLEATEGVHEKALERAQEEPMAFNVPSPDLVVVANERHDEPAEHTYAVVVDDGLPVHCSCPADANFRTACKHRIGVALNEAVLLAASTDADEHEREPVALPDGGQVLAVRSPELDAENTHAHAEGCSDPNCEGLDAEGRPELSWECWEVWSSEDQDHDFADERADVDLDLTPTRADVDDRAIEAVLRAFSRGEI